MADYQFTDHFTAVEKAVMDRINVELEAIGAFLVSHMQTEASAFIRTGEFYRGIHDTVDHAAHVLTVYMDAQHSVYVEFGTRNQAPHPVARNAIFDATARWHLGDVVFNLHPMIVSPSHLRASASGFTVPKSAKLTARQAAHVKTVLRPVSRSLAGKIRRRGVTFKVVGPKHKRAI